MSFGDVIRSAAAPGTQPIGIGGDNNTIWHTNDDPVKLYELSTVDLSVVRSNTPIANQFDTGGKANVIWHVDLGNKRIYEISTVDLSIIRFGSSPTNLPKGIGGDSSTLWHSEYQADRIYELDVSDFSSIRYTSSPDTEPWGIGGNTNNIWHCDTNSDLIYELNTSDLSVNRSASSPGVFPTGVGGDTDTLWHTDYVSNLVYELDAPPSTHTISGTVSDEWGNKIRDVEISISNGTTYTTTTDGNGAYSQVVNPDTYNITASKPSSSFHDITESSVSISADTTKNIIIPTDKIAGKHSTKGTSIIGGISLGIK